MRPTEGCTTKRQQAKARHPWHVNFWACGVLVSGWARTAPHGKSVASPPLNGSTDVIVAFRILVRNIGKAEKHFMIWDSCRMLTTILLLSVILLLPERHKNGRFKRKCPAWALNTSEGCHSWKISLLEPFLVSLWTAFFLSSLGYISNRHACCFLSRLWVAVIIEVEFTCSHNSLSWYGTNPALFAKIFTAIPSRFATVCQRKNIQNV